MFGLVRMDARGVGVVSASVLIGVACGSAESRPAYDAPAPLHYSSAGSTGTGPSGGDGGASAAAGSGASTGGTGGDIGAGGTLITAGSGNAAGSSAMGGAGGSSGSAVGGGAGNVALGGSSGDGASGGDAAGMSGADGGEGGAPAPPVDCSSHGETADDFDGHCYLYRDATLTWPEAVDDCKGRDGHLVTISSEGRSARRFLGENAFVWQLAHETESWIDATDGKGLHQKGDGTFFEWNDGEPMTLDNWSSGQPNNSSASCDTQSGTCYEHCAYQWATAGREMDSVPGWNDRVCDHGMGFVCEWDE